MERDSWLASMFAILPESETASLIASVLSSQIVHPTAVPESPRSRMAPAQRRRRRGVCGSAAPAIRATNPSFPYRLGIGTGFPGIRGEYGRRRPNGLTRVRHKQRVLFKVRG